MNININDKFMIADKPYRVYNIINEYKGGLVCFGRINNNGKDLSAKNPHNITSLTFEQVEYYTKLGSIARM